MLNLSDCGRQPAESFSYRNRPVIALPGASGLPREFVRCSDDRREGKQFANMSSIDMSKQKQMEIPHGTLDLLILKTLEALGSMHGYAIARRIEQVSENALRLSQGAIYPALIRLQQEGWINTEWGISETNRKVKFYSLTKAGRKQLLVEVATWEKSTAFVGRFLGQST